MTDFTIDSNVPISANGRDTHASLSCSLACINQLQQIVADSRIVLDDQELIFNEYKRHLHFDGQPGVGDYFFKHIFHNKHNKKHVTQVSITPCNESKGFSGLPENDLDPSDRKFLACAVLSNSDIVNATDSDWSENQ
ncbi:MAG: hypothetical protein HOE44_15015 [Candidatus Marinimicrobia bacterium]|jgi:hypothetical protein|nr:hypothetical protein [Candidatus Neomarinimicrobiota bacterium]